MFLSNDVFSFQKPFPLLFDVIWSPSSIVEWSVRYPGVILDSLILTNPTEIRKKSILENTRFGLLPLHVNNNFSGFWCLKISTNSVSSIHALIISLDLSWVPVFLPHLSLSIFSTRLKSPPIILLSLGIHSISFIKRWKKCGSSWFGAYRFASVIRTSCTSMSYIINLPSWSITVECIVCWTLAFIRTHSPRESFFPWLNIQFWPHSFFHWSSTSFVEWVSCKNITEWGLFSIHWNSCLRLLLSRIPFTFSDRKLIHSFLFLVMVVFLSYKWLIF